MEKLKLFYSNRCINVFEKTQHFPNNLVSKSYQLTGNMLPTTKQIDQSAKTTMWVTTWQSRRRPSPEPLEASKAPRARLGTDRPASGSTWQSPVTSGIYPKLILARDTRQKSRISPGNPGEKGSGGCSLVACCSNG